MNGETKSVPMYKPVAFNPFNDAESPSCSKIIDMSGSNIPCENPEMDTMVTKIQNLLFSDGENCFMMLSSIQVKIVFKSFKFRYNFIIREEYKLKYIMTEHGFETNLEFGKLTISSNETYGFRPYQLLVSSLVSCSGGVLKKVCEKMRMPIEEMEIEVKEVVRNEEIANRLEKVHIHFKLKGSNLEEVKLQKAMNLTTKNCSMVRSVDQSIEVHETFEIM